MSETKMKYDWDDAKSCYEAGMFYFTNEERNRGKINKGINLLKQACKLGSPEASFVMGKLVCEAILSGMRDWAGEYTVFGGQQLTVVVDLEENAKLFDVLDVFIMDEGTKQLMRQVAERVDVLNGGNASKNVNAMLKSNRSFAAMNKEWKVKGKKTIFIRCKENEVENYEYIRGVARHEFGHILGLGDLYYEKAKGFDGVEKGTYDELDPYHITDKIYHLAMCDNHGTISNNDIEMIVLAFSENAVQNYQPTSWNYEVSEALGKGN